MQCLCRSLSLRQYNNCILGLSQQYNEKNKIQLIKLKLKCKYLYIIKNLLKFDFRGCVFVVNEIQVFSDPSV